MWLWTLWELDEKMSRCVVWECVAALDLGDMAAPAPHLGEKLHPHPEAPTSLPVPQLSSLSLCYISLFNQVEFTNCMHLVQCSTSSLSRGCHIWSSVWVAPSLPALLALIHLTITHIPSSRITLSPWHSRSARRQRANPGRFLTPSTNCGSRMLRFLHQKHELGKKQILIQSSGWADEGIKEQQNDGEEKTASKSRRQL